MFACASLIWNTRLLQEIFLVPLGVFHSAEEKPNSVLQENIEKSHYAMFRFNVLDQEVWK